MNICILTARLIKKPRLIFKHNNFIVEIFICIPNNNNTLLCHNIKCRATGKIAKNIFDLYKKGDFILIEGLIQVNRNQILNKSKSLKVIKSLYIKVKKIHPAFLFLI